MSGDPGDTEGGTFTGGDDDRVFIPQPPPPPVSSCRITSPVQAELVVNTKDSSVTQTYNFTAARGSGNAAINWAITPDTYGSTFVGGADTAKSLTLTFPRYNTAIGTFILSISSADGGDSQNWPFQLTNSTGGGLNYWGLQTDNSIKNLNANGVQVTGNLTCDSTLTANRVLGVSYADISDVPPAAESFWRQLGDSNIVNTNPYGLNLGDNTYINESFTLSPKLIFSNAIGKYLGNSPDDEFWLPNPVYTTYYVTYGGRNWYYRQIIDNNGMLDWGNLKNVPNLPTVADQDAGIALGALGAGLGLLLTGGMLASTFSNRIADWAQRTILREPNVQIQTDDNGRTTQSDYVQTPFPELVQVPFVATQNGEAFGIAAEFYLRESNSMYTYPASGYYTDGHYNRSMSGGPNYSGRFKFFDGAMKYFYGARYNADLWSFRSNGIYYDDHPILYRQEDGNFVFNGTATGDNSTVSRAPGVTTETPISNPNAGDPLTQPDRQRRFTDFFNNNTTNNSQPLARRSAPVPPVANQTQNQPGLFDRLNMFINRGTDGAEAAINRSAAQITQNAARASRSAAQVFDRAGNPATYRAAARELQIAGRNAASRVGHFFTDISRSVGL